MLYVQAMDWLRLVFLASFKNRKFEFVSDHENGRCANLGVSITQKCPVMVVKPRNVVAKMHSLIMKSLINTFLAADC